MGFIDGRRPGALARGFLSFPTANSISMIEVDQMLLFPLFFIFLFTRPTIVIDAHTRTTTLHI